MSIDWARVKQVLAEAAARNSLAERAAYLDDACRGDVSLRAQVERLLAAHDQSGAFLETSVVPAADVAIEVSITEKAGDRIGPYKLLQQIGEGGCGVVYMAEQELPIRRRVALKVIKLGMNTKAVVARFEAERQALALMDHPNIARVLDAGATDTGRPYFVMELVRGIRITEYSDQNHLSTEARLRLFVQVCQALQHAHQKGIIHRDIKPSNILVTLHDGAPMPKVIDFGIAKATDQRLTEKTLFTSFEQFIGTPAYMSPEQAQMSTLDIDTRSDIYSLGALLYELLTGQTPFDPKELVSAGLDGMRQILREQEPKRPSTRLSTLMAAAQTTVARCRQSEPPQLIHRLRGDLDWIVMRCLEKDRTRRYETASNLAEDVLRHLNDEPVTARPPSQVYRFQKLVQRNKVTFAAGATVAAALVLGLGFSLWRLAQERVARRQALAAEQRAGAESGKSRQVAQLLKDMLQGVGPSVALGRDTTLLREVLDKTAARVGTDLKGQPEVEAELRATLGEVYQSLGHYDQAEAMYRVSLALRQTLWGEMHTNVADSLDLLGRELHSCRTEIKESASLIERALTIRTNLLGPEHVLVATSLYHLGAVREHQGKVTEAFEILHRALALRRRLLGNNTAGVAEALTALASLTWYVTSPQEAETYAREALAVLSRLPADERGSLTLASAQEALGMALHSQGKREEAVRLMRNVVACRKNLLESRHPDYGYALYHLGEVLTGAARFEEAEVAFREALAIYRQTLGDRHRRTAFCYEKLGHILRNTDRWSEAETAYRAAREGWGLATPALIGLLRDHGKTAEAEAVVLEENEKLSRAAEEASKLPPSAESVDTLLGLLGNPWPRGQLAQTEPLLAKLLEMAKQVPPSVESTDLIFYEAMRLAALEVWFGRQPEHAVLCRQLIEWAACQPKLTPKGRAAAVANLRPLADLQLQATALDLARQAAEGATQPWRGWYQLTLGVAEYRNGHYPEASCVLTAVEVSGSGEARYECRTATARFFRAMLLFRQGQETAARQLFSETERKIPPPPAAAVEGADYDELMRWLACKEARELLSPP